MIAYSLHPASALKRTTWSFHRYAAKPSPMMNALDPLLGCLHGSVPARLGMVNPYEIAVAKADAVYRDLGARVRLSLVLSQVSGYWSWPAMVSRSFHRIPLRIIMYAFTTALCPLGFI